MISRHKRGRKGTLHLVFVRTANGVTNSTSSAWSQIIYTTLCENLSYLSSCFIPLTFYLIFIIFNILNPPGDLSINHEIYLEPPWRIEYNTCNIHPLNPLGDLSINHEISLEPSWRLENKTWNIPSSPWRLENKTWNVKKWRK